MLAPIVLFVYNRLHHTQQTIKALQKNTLADKSNLYIYSDAPKDANESKQVIKLREYIHSVDGFKSVTIIERKYNFGLANSIINGVTNIVNKYGSIIVLEDDMVTSPYFLNFMNDALNFYKSEQKVWHISGWNYPIEDKQTPNTFLWSFMNCWGWGTWKDRWKYYEKDTDKLLNEFSEEDIFRFNLDGSSNFWSQVQANKSNEINTWAVYWNAIIFKNKGLCLNPVITYVDNIGLDGTGTQCGRDTNHDSQLLNTSQNPVFPRNVVENEQFTNKIKDFYKAIPALQYIPWYKKCINKVARKLIGKNLLS